MCNDALTHSIGKREHENVMEIGGGTYMFIVGEIWNNKNMTQHLR